MAIAKMQAEQAMHQEQRKQPHTTQQYASSEPNDDDSIYVNVTPA